MTNKELNRKATVAGFFYVCAQFLARGITFLITPVYARLLSTAQFGAIRVYESWLLILAPVLSLCLYNSLEKGKFDFAGEYDEFVSSIQTLSYISILTGFSVITLLFYEAFAEFCKLNILMYVYMILYILAHTAVFCFQKKEKQLLRYKSTAAVMAVTTIPSTLLSVLLLYLGVRCGRTEDLVNLRVIGFYTPYISCGIVVAILMWKQGHFVVRKKYWKYALKYSVPLIPATMSIHIMNQSDKIMIQKLVDSESAGIFAMATTVSYIMWIVEDAVWGAWLPWFYEKISRKEIKEIRKPWYFTVAIFGFGSWITVLLAPEIIYIFGGEKYAAAVYLVAPMVTGTLLRFFSNIFTAVENYQQKTIYTAVGIMLAMVINVILNAVCITRLGYEAAAYTTAFSYLVLLLIQGILEKKICGLQCVSLLKMFLISLGVIGINLATNLLFGMAWYIRWALGLLVSVAFLIKVYPDILQFMKLLKRGE